MESKLLIFNI
uniref:Uncharacterized protein n=1 Tax=Arundo donax TaxID=35708 RepID=A0A0A9FWN8_ARUDO